jgi:hypothetical protein
VPLAAGRRSTRARSPITTHAPVVRRLRSLGRVSPGGAHTTATLDLEPTWNPRALRVVVFVQLAGSRKIVGAAAT